MSGQEYSRRFDGRIAGALDDDLYDTLVIAAGDVVAKQTLSLFQIQVGGTGKTAGGTSYTKDYRHTNMVRGGMMEFGNWFIVDAIGFRIVASDREFNAVTAGMPTDLTAATTASTVSSPLLAAGLGGFCVATFWLGDRWKARGPLEKFPSAYGYTGAIGNHDSGFTQNGQPGVVVPLEQIVVLEPEQDFRIEVDFYAATTVNTNVCIRPYLSGVRLRPVAS
jgi:hypothetical protein